MFKHLPIYIDKGSIITV